MHTSRPKFNHRNLKHVYTSGSKFNHRKMKHVYEHMTHRRGLDSRVFGSLVDGNFHDTRTLTTNQCLFIVDQTSRHEYVDYVKQPNAYISSSYV